MVKPNVRKTRKIGEHAIGGFAGATADAFTLFERLEGKLEEHPGQLTRAAVELAKMWRLDKYLRRLDVRLPGLHLACEGRALAGRATAVSQSLSAGPGRARLEESVTLSAMSCHA